MAKEDISQRIEELKNEGHTVYSISRLNNFNQCKLGYYYTYVKKDRGKDSIYGTMGGCIHDCLQNICDGNGTYQDMINTYNTELNRCRLIGMKFPSEKIGESWNKDMVHFVTNFRSPYNKTLTEKGFVTKVGDVYIQGFIDLMTPNSDSVDVIDWKSSSSFKGDKLLHAGRQLVLYKLAVEKEFDIPVNEVMWYMMKYVYVNYDGKQKMCNRGKWVKEISNLLKTQLKKLGITEILIPMMIDKAIDSNTLDNMPQEVRDRFGVTDCIVKYDVTDDVIKETESYIIESVKEIEGMGENIEDYLPCNIEKENFFCSTLCSHSDKCSPYKEWLEKNKDSFKKKY